MLNCIKPKTEKRKMKNEKRNKSKPYRCDMTRPSLTTNERMLLCGMSLLNYWKL